MPSLQIAILEQASDDLHLDEIIFLACGLNLDIVASVVDAVLAEEAVAHDFVLVQQVCHRVRVLARERKKRKKKIEEAVSEKVDQTACEQEQLR